MRTAPRCVLGQLVTRTILLIVIGLAMVMLASPFTVNGLPSLDSPNPHAQ